MPTLAQAAIALIAAGCLTTAYRFWRWERREHARIEEYRGRVREQSARSLEDTAYMLARSSASLGMAVEEIRRVRSLQVEGDALLMADLGLHVVKNGVS